MKKILVLTILMLCFLSVSYAYNIDDIDLDKLDKAMNDLSKFEKDLYFKHSSNLRNCRGGNIAVKTADDHELLFNGMQNGQCHYSKAKVQNMVHGHTVSDCYAPLSVVNSLADAYEQYSKIPISDSAAENEQKNLIQEKINELENYCSPTSNPFYF